jgi:monofunctional biosynthetic peptidoglycan transglycosylase
MDAASRRNWHRKRKRLKQIEARARAAREASNAARGSKPGFFGRLFGRRSRAKRGLRERPVVDQSDAKGWTWGFEPSPPSRRERAETSSAQGGDLLHEPHEPLDSFAPGRSRSERRRGARRPVDPPWRSPAKRSLTGGRLAGAGGRPEAGAPPRSGSHRLRRLVALTLVFFVFAPAIPVALLRFLPPLGSAMMAQRWWSARVEGRDFDLQYEWVPADEIARSLRAAVVASEDQRFYDHAGFDWKELRNAVDDWRDGDSLRGASTISQQVAKNLFLWPGRSFVRKGFEAWFTLWIEWLWPKERILEVYLNIVELGDGVFGAEAASRRYFKHPAAKLVPHESALLAAMLPSPLRSNPLNPSEYLRKRQRWILRQL